MLIEFKVANFRSIREEQTFSLVASNTDHEHLSSVIDRDLPGLAKTRFLRGAAIYGANASGKSNLLDAVAFLQRFVLRSATRLSVGEATGTQPFKLDAHSLEQPSTFEITFVAAGVRYVFGLSVTQERIIEEYLVAYPKGQPQRWYARRYNKKAKVYVWTRPSEEFKHDKSLEGKTRANSLFLSVAPQFNHPQLTPVYNWFKSGLRFIDCTKTSQLRFTAQQFGKPGQRERMLKMLRSADFGVTDASIEEKQISVEEYQAMSFSARRNGVATFSPQNTVTNTTIELIHTAADGRSMPLDFRREESEGTRRFFSLVGPWIDVLDNAHTLFIDEIESSMHPILVRELLESVFCPDRNPKGAQIIFTTHNALLLDTAFMRRDQIWFTEKSPEGATHLYPLTDYHPRKEEALVKGYLAGRYGGVPFIPEGLQL